MPITIKDGTGNNFEVRVDKDHRLHVFSTSLPEEHHVNEIDGKNWTVSFDAVNPTNATSYFVSLNNTAEKTRAIVRLNVTSTIAGYVELQEVTGTVSGGDTTLGPLSRTLGGSAPANFVARSGVDITGLTEVGKHRFIWCQANVEREIEFPGTIRMVQNTLLALQATATGVFTGSFELYEED